MNQIVTQRDISLLSNLLRLLFSNKLSKEIDLFSCSIHILKISSAFLEYISKRERRERKRERLPVVILLSMHNKKAELSLHQYSDYIKKCVI